MPNSSDLLEQAMVVPHPRAGRRLECTTELITPVRTRSGYGARWEGAEEPDP